MRTRRTTKEPANAQITARSATDSEWMGPVYLGVIVAEVFVLVTLWAVGMYFSSL
jgi:hypothetical protein